MASETKALVETATGLVVNLIVYDPEGNWVPPEGHTLEDPATHPFTPDSDEVLS